MADFKKVYNGWLKVYNSVRPVRGRDFTFEYIIKRPAVGALIYNSLTDKFIFVKQYRPGCGRDIIEIPAGVIEEGQSPIEAIEREVLEETGYKCDKIEFITSGAVSPGYTTETLFLYYIEVSNKIGMGGGLEDENEEIEVIEMTKSQFLDHEFEDMKTNLCKFYIQKTII